MRTRLHFVRRDEQAGFTLVELLVTMTIMAISFVVILAAIGVFIRSTSVQRASADIDSALRTYVERLDTVDYTACAPSYAVSATNLPADFLTKFEPTVAVKYWDGVAASAGYGSACTTGSDKGVQQLTVTLTGRSTSQSERLVVVKRDEVQP